MTSDRIFTCDKYTDGIRHGVETRLFVQAIEYGQLGTCAGHAAEMLAAVSCIWPDAKLHRWTKSMVERWGAVEITIEDAVFVPGRES